MPGTEFRPVPETVGKPLQAALREISQLSLTYAIQYTSPPKQTFALLHTMYVLRQRIDSTGTVHLLAAAKMGKEVQ